MGRALQARRRVKAFLLAGGRGERLRPMTLTMPKCLVPVDGAPILGLWLDLLEQHGIRDVLVNVSQFPEQVERFVAQRPDGPRVIVVREPEPIGNAGTVARHRHFVESDEDFWIIYSDNLAMVDLQAMQRFHDGHDGLLTMGLFEAPDPTQAGIVVCDDAGRITGFIEKPQHPVGRLANAGLYLARRALLDAIPRRDGVTDFGMDVFPALAGQLCGCRLDGVLIDIGTHEGLARATHARACARHGGERP